MARISGPLLDRMDLHVAMQPYEPLSYMTEAEGESTQAVAARVATARHQQATRQGDVVNAVAALDSLQVSPAAQDMAQSVAARFRFSARGYTRLLRVARTIADLAAEAWVEPAHVAEAATFRVRGGGQ